MAIPVVLRTTLNAVLNALDAYLQVSLTFPPERVLLVGRDDLNYDPQADQYLLLRARKGGWDKARDGGGRFENRHRRRVTVTLRTRLALDESSQDALWLTHPALGQYVTEHALFNTLEMWQAEDSDGNVLLLEPVHLDEATAAERPAKEYGWGDAAYSFDALYDLDLNQDVQ